MKLQKLFNIFVCGCAVLALGACSDDNGDEPAPDVQETDAAHLRCDATYNSLTFSWDKIAGVNQYGYTLRDASGELVDEGVTDRSSVTVGGLATDKPYDFELRLYGAAGETSWHTSMEASTLPITPLAKPEVTVSQQGAYVRVEWKPVENAEYYHCYYTVGDLPLELVTSDTHCLLAGLAPGKHSVGVTADTEYGGYTESERTEAQAVRSRTETGTVTGTYTSGLMQRKNKWECTMHIYDDGTYRIDSFYQTPGYDLDFYVDTDTETGASYIGLLNFKSITAVNDYRIETGRESVPEIGVLTGLVDGELASSFTGDATSGLVTFTTTYSTLTRTDKFEW